jgi:hypothetical protein
MVVKLRQLAFIIWGFSMVLSSHAQHVNAFAQVRLSKRSVYAQEPIRATVTVYTATWFTQPLEFDNLQIPNAFIIPFSRTMPGMYQINGKQFAGLEFYYLIYPYKPGAYELPAISVVAETPPEGDYHGTRVTLKTKPIPYTVKSIPSSYGNAEWFVARNVTMSVHWNRSLQSIKVGDLVERTVRVSAHGTLPNFIPELKTTRVEGVSTYSGDPQLIDQRNDEAANGTRIEKETFLFEKEGTVTIPGITIQWWDPIRQRVMHRMTKAVEVKVAVNEDLGMLATVRDSLKSQQAQGAPSEKSKPPYEFLGMNWEQLSILVVLSSIGLYLLIRVMVWGIRKVRIKRMAYRQTEKYWFRKFEHATTANIANNFYGWWDRLPNESASFSESRSSEEVLRDWQAIEDSLMRGEAPSGGVPAFKKKMGIERRNILHKVNAQKTDRHQQIWVD